MFTEVFLAYFFLKEASEGEPIKSREMTSNSTQVFLGLLVSGGII